MDRIFKPPFSMTESHIPGPGEVSIPFLLDQSPNVASVGLDSEGGRTRAKGSLWRRSVELRASGAVGLHWRAVFGCQMG
jgi:hypothetical protein